MNFEELHRRVLAAITAFEEQDFYLLENDLNERCISGRLAFHLQILIPEYHVDVEYNRAGADPKRLGVPEECTNSSDSDGDSLVVPDVIVHYRGPDGPNLLGVELKKTSDRRGQDCDRRRIEALQAELGYTFGVLIECETRANRKRFIRVVEWFPKGIRAER